MSSRIEQLIDEIEEYIDSCKYQPLSNTRIIVNKEEIDELLRELRMKTPDEIKRYQKIISNKEAILNDARAKAEELIKKAEIQTTELISEHEIMQQAYTQANEVVTMATRQAQDILDNATMEANNMRMAAMQYTDDILANVDNMLTQIIKTSKDHYDSFLGALSNYSDVVNANRVELNPPEADRYIPDSTESESSGEGISLDLL